MKLETQEIQLVVIKLNILKEPAKAGITLIKGEIGRQHEEMIYRVNNEAEETSTGQFIHHRNNL